MGVLNERTAPSFKEMEPLPSASGGRPSCGRSTRQACHAGPVLVHRGNGGDADAVLDWPTRGSEG